MTDIPTLFADFHNADQQGRIRFSNNGTIADIKRMNLELKNGMLVFLDDDNSLTTIGHVNYSDEEKIWVAVINWNEIKHSNNLPDDLSNSKV